MQLLSSTHIRRDWIAGRAKWTVSMAFVALAAACGDGGGGGGGQGSGLSNNSSDNPNNTAQECPESGDVTGEMQFVQIDVAGDHGCGILTTGKIACWGKGDDSTVDDPEGVDLDQSVPPAGTFKQVNVGDYHSCAIGEDDTVTCWGAGTDPDAEEHAYADDDQSVAPDGTFTQISVTRGYSCGLMTDGTAVCWGDGPQPPADKTFEYIDVAWGQQGHDPEHLNACGVLDDGSIECWSETPWVANNDTSGPFATMCSGREHSCGLGEDGKAECWLHSEWGGSDFGIPDPPDTAFASIACTSDSTCGLTADGQMECWGVGDGPPQDTYSQLASHANALLFWCGVREDGTVRCSGNNTYGELCAP